MCSQGPVTVSQLRTVNRRRKRINPITGAYTDDNGHPAKEGETAVTLGKVDLVSSTKLRALVRKLDVMAIEEPDMKVLVFSQFTSFLGELPALKAVRNQPTDQSRPCRDHPDESRVPMAPL